MGSGSCLKIVGQVLEERLKRRYGDRQTATASDAAVTMVRLFCQKHSIYTYCGYQKGTL